MSHTAARPRKHTSRTARAAAGQPSGFTLPTRQALLALGLMAAATLAVYFPVGHHPFVNYDDGGYVINNANIKSGLDWATISWAFSTFYQGNWHPLTWLSHALDWQLFGLEPGGHHIVNLLLHVVNVVLLFWVLWRATGQAGRSLLVAGLFALHPLNVESVAWIAERKNLLSMMFFLLALEAYRRYVRQPGAGRYAAVAGLYALGLMAKPQVITLPFVLLLWDYWPLRRLRLQPVSASADDGADGAPGGRSFVELLKEKTGLFLIAAAGAVVTFIAQRSGGAMGEIYTYALPVRLGNALISYAWYVGKAFWPAHLAVFYPHPDVVAAWKVIGALIFLAAITGLVLKFRKHRYLVVGWLWFLGTLVPMIGLVQVGGQATADRYAYLPLIGLFIMAAWGLGELADQRHFSPKLLWGGSVALLLVMAAATYHQLEYWNDNLTLWEHTLQVTSGNYIAQDNIGGLLMDQGRMEEAMQHFRAASAIYAIDPTSVMQIAMYDQQHGNLPEALEQYEELLPHMHSPVQRSEVLANEGFIYGRQRDYARAQAAFRAAVDASPANGRAWMGLGVLAQRSGDLNAAIEDYSRSLKAQPSDVTYLLMAKALEQSGRAAESQAATRQAQVVSSDLNRARQIADGFLAH